MTGKQLVQGRYAVAWVGVEPTTFELQGTTLSTEPRRPVRSVSRSHRMEACAARKVLFVSVGFAVYGSWIIQVHLDL